MQEDVGCCHATKGLDFRLCWRANSSSSSQQKTEEGVVVVAGDGKTMYPDVNDNNAMGSGGFMISWPEQRCCCSKCSNSSSSQSAASNKSTVHISLLSPEDGKPDVARWKN